MICPEIYQLAGKLSSIIGKQILRCPTLLHEAVQNLNNMFAAEPQTNLDRQCLAAKDINHSQGPEFLAVTQLVMHKIQAPSLVSTPRPTTSLPTHHHFAPLRTLAA